MSDRDTTRDPQRLPDLVIPAHVTLRAADTLDSAEPDLLTLAKRRALTPSVFETYPPAFLSAAISNNTVDSYFTRMGRSTLRNYAEDAAAGVPVMTNHDRSRLNVGRSLTGHYTGGQGDGNQRATSDFYVLRGYQTPDGLRTDDLLAGVQAGLYRDVSVGFTNERYVCDLCQRELLSPGCNHYPGDWYDAEGKPTTATAKGARQATATVEDARLAEYSVVWAGSTPGALITKAQRMVDAGWWNREQAAWFEQTTRTRLRGTEPVWAVQSVRPPPEPEPEKGTGMDPEELQRQLADERKARQADREAHTAALKGVTDERDALTRQLAELTPLADFGRKRHAELVEATVREGVRVHGKAWGEKEEQHRQRFAAMGADDLTFWHGQLTDLAAVKYPGGRQTGEAAVPGERQEGKPEGSGHLDRAELAELRAARI